MVQYRRLDEEGLITRTLPTSGRALAPIFVHLPPQAQYPDYYQLIQRPVSFQLVRVRFSLLFLLGINPS